MKKRIILLVTVLVAVALVTSGCAGEKTTEKQVTSRNETENITDENLSFVCDALKAGGLSNVDIFEQWVKDGIKGTGDKVQ